MNGYVQVGGVILLDVLVWLAVYRLQRHGKPRYLDDWGRIERNTDIITANVAVIVLNLIILVIARVLS